MRLLTNTYTVEEYEVRESPNRAEEIGARLRDGAIREVAKYHPAAVSTRPSAEWGDERLDVKVSSFVVEAEDISVLIAALDYWLDSEGGRWPGRERAIDMLDILRTVVLHGALSGVGHE